MWIKINLFFTLSILYPETNFSINIESFSQIFKQENFSQIQNILENGSMGGYLNYTEYINLINEIKKEFEDLLTVDSIGKTIENRDIPIIKLENKLTSSGMLFTGMHHAREPVSFHMCLNILLKILHEYKKGNQLMIELVNSRNIYFIPIINIDGFIFNTQVYKNSSQFGMARKNRRKQTMVSVCDLDSIGVDLNRNYDFHYSENDSGSNSNNCAEDYRGIKAFSEPETLAIKEFLDDHSIRIAYNYHSYGNLLITPFSYDNKENNNLKNNFPEFFDLYNEFHKEANFPTNDVMGNGLEAIGYDANGEASDYMLGIKNILSFSPELGVNNELKDSEYESFYPPIKKAYDIINANLNAAFYGIQKSGYFLKALPVKNFYQFCIACNEDLIEFTSMINIQNYGLGKINSFLNLNLKIEFSHVEKLKINLNDKEVLSMNYTNNFSEMKKILTNITIPKLDPKLNVGLEIRLYTRNESLNSSFIKIYFDDENKEISGISNIVFSSPKLLIVKSDYNLIYNEENLIVRSNNFYVLKYIFYILIILVVLAFIFTNKTVKDFIISRIKSRKSIVSSREIQEINKSNTYDNL